METAAHIREAGKLLTDDEADAAIALVASNPTIGDVIEGTGGIRKVRVARGGKGKRGGARIVYYYNDTTPVFMLTIFGKNEKENLSKAERNALAKLVEAIRTSYGNGDRDVANKAFDKIADGLEDALACAQGDKTRGTAHVIDVDNLDVAAIRRKLGLSQDRFAGAFGISVATLRGWERHKRTPTGPARALLTIIDREPAAVRRALALGV